MQSTIRVFIVDDHDLVRAGISRMFSSAVDMEVVGEANSGEQALERCPPLKPDVILLDVNMPGMGGVEAISALLKLLPSTKILVVTASLDKALVPQFFQRGVSGFFSKVDGQEELIKAVRTVFSGRPYVSPSIAQKMSFKSGGLVLYPFDLLSERELQVVLLLFNGFTLEDISKWFSIRMRTIKTYRVRAYEKLGIKNDVELTLLAGRHGFLTPSVQET